MTDAGCISAEVPACTTSTGQVSEPGAVHLAIAGDLYQELAQAKAEVERLRSELARQGTHCQALQVASPLTDVDFIQPLQYYDRHNRHWCHSWCPCCRRPLDITVLSSSDHNRKLDDQPFPKDSQSKPAAYAYVASIWGEDSGFIMGALVCVALLGNLFWAGALYYHTC